MAPLLVAISNILAHRCRGVGVIHTIIGGWRPHGKNFFDVLATWWSGCGHRSGLIEADSWSAGPNGSPRIGSQPLWRA